MRNAVEAIFQTCNGLFGRKYDISSEYFISWIRNIDRQRYSRLDDWTTS